MIKEIEKVLKNISKYEAKISDIELEIADLKDLHSISISGINYDNLVKTNSLISKTELQAIKDMEIERTIEILEYEKRHIERLLIRIDNAISSLSDIEKQIIQMKCLDNKIWRFITFEVGLEERQCRQIKRKALEKISHVINLEDIVKFNEM
ncbi:hypothetical protein [Wukongibacter sp. M2B1]|uniref:hypothetical protein n=1 Tax=Wukongibacter sp. M2B1 TaxID=3088895 RepID=UPI003D793E79